MITLPVLLRHYKRADIQHVLCDAAVNKEVAVLFGDHGYGKRPDALQFPRDVLEFAKKGATSFHCSEEHWSNPLQVTTGMPRRELDVLRIGWDLILDIDCAQLEYSQLAAHVLVQALGHHGITQVGIKFSGNHGFHIGVPWASFPEVVNGRRTKDLFPEGPRRIAAYLQAFTRTALAEAMLAREDIAQIAQKTGKHFAELVVGGKLDPYKVLTIDTVLIASRHLYRMPYSLNDKSGLVSITVKPEELLSFDKTRAMPDAVKSVYPFLPKGILGEATQLLIQAFDFTLPPDEKKKGFAKEYSDLTTAIPEDFFPPCMQNILKGMRDGKKRSLFVLVNFLHSVGWDHERIQARLKEWNTRNEEPLRDVLIEGAVRYHKQQAKKVLPPNCFNQAHYMELGFCQPDAFCPRIKNPANYAILKQKVQVNEESKRKPKKVEKAASAVKA